MWSHEKTCDCESMPWSSRNCPGLRYIKHGENGTIKCASPVFSSILFYSNSILFCSFLMPSTQAFFEQQRLDNAKRVQGISGATSGSTSQSSTICTTAAAAPGPPLSSLGSSNTSTAATDGTGGISRGCVINVYPPAQTAVHLPYTATSYTPTQALMQSQTQAQVHGGLFGSSSTTERTIVNGAHDNLLTSVSSSSSSASASISRGSDATSVPVSASSSAPSNLRSISTLSSPFLPHVTPPGPAATSTASAVTGSYAATDSSHFTTSGDGSACAGRLAPAPVLYSRNAYHDPPVHSYSHTLTHIGHAAASTPAQVHVVSTAYGDTSQQQEQEQQSGGFDIAPFSRDILPVFYSIPTVIARDGDGSGSGQVDDGGSIGRKRSADSAELGDVRDEQQQRGDTTSTTVAASVQVQEANV
jgi:hypothetical protein